MAIEYKDYYAILGVPKTASPDDVKKAYRRLAKEHHPDLHAEKNKLRATEKFKEINEAYEVLSDPKKKTQYDQIGPGWDSQQQPGPAPRQQQQNPGFDFGGGEEGGFSGFSDFFDKIYGDQERRTGPRPPRKGQDVEAEMPLSLEDAVRGGEKRLTLNVPTLCPACAGTGRRGNGFCPNCGGVGEIPKEKTITARLPKTVQDGMRLRLKGQGTPSPGGEAGDLYLRIRLMPHPQFKVNGADLETPVTIMPWVAALGGEVSVPSLEGPVRIKIPPGTHADLVLRVAGKGLGREDGTRGDLHAVIRIDIPGQSNPQLEGLYQKLKEAAQ